MGVNNLPFLLSTVVPFIGVLILAGAIVRSARLNSSQAAVPGGLALADLEECRRKLAEETNAKNDREGRYQQVLVDLAATRESNIELLKLVESLNASLNTPNRDRPSRDYSAPYYQGEPGFRIESAMFGAFGCDPIPVKERVIELGKQGGPVVPVSWEALVQRDISKWQEKFLTITFSITEREHGTHGICLPNRLFMAALNRLIKGLDELEKEDVDRQYPLNFREGHLNGVVRRCQMDIDLIRELSNMLAVRADHIKEQNDRDALLVAAKRLRGEVAHALEEAR
jgi:hypothetical protein